MEAEKKNRRFRKNSQIRQQIASINLENSTNKRSTFSPINKHLLTCTDCEGSGLIPSELKILPLNYATPISFAPA